MRSKATRTSIIVVLWVGLASALIWPVQAHGRSGENKRLAKQYFRQGSKDFAKGRYAQAIRQFKKAYTYWQNPRIMLNIAICHMELRQSIQAVTALRKALKTTPPDKRRSLLRKLPSRLKAMVARVAVLKVRMPDPAAEIYINERLIGRAYVEKVLRPGRYRVVVKLNGQVKASKKVRLRRGQTEAWELDDWPSSGGEEIESPPPARRETGPETPPDHPGRPKAGWRKKLARLHIAYFLTAAAVAVVGGVATIALGVKTNDYHAEYWDNPSAETRDKGRQTMFATNAMIGITAVAGVAAVVLGVFTRWEWPSTQRERSSDLRVLPLVRPDGGGLVLSSEF